MRNDHHLLRTVASGVVQLSEVPAPGAFSLPYPGDAQRALDRLAAGCLRRGLSPPRSIPDLVTWCARRPLSQWPLEMPAGVAGAGDLLVDPHTCTPTQLCYELAIDSRDTGTELYEREMMFGALERCRTAEAPDSYTALRDLFVRYPVLTRAKLGLLHARAELLPVMDLIEQAYRPAPVGLAVDGRFAACARCRCLLVPAGRGRWWCEQDRCRREGVAQVGEEYPVSGNVHQLARPLRIFVTGPGRAEIELEERLTALGLQVEMWPNYDAYDLRVTLPDGSVWAIDVKDRANPALLARTTTPFRIDPPFTTAYLVVPQYRTQDRPDYRQVFARNCPPEVAAVVHLSTDRELITAARRAVRTEGDVNHA